MLIIYIVVILDGILGVLFIVIVNIGYVMFIVDIYWLLFIFIIVVVIVDVDILKFIRNW